MGAVNTGGFAMVVVAMAVVAAMTVVAAVAVVAALAVVAAVPDDAVDAAALVADAAMPVAAATHVAAAGTDVDFAQAGAPASAVVVMPSLMGASGICAVLLVHFLIVCKAIEFVHEGAAAAVAFFVDFPSVGWLILLLQQRLFGGQVLLLAAVIYAQFALRLCFHTAVIFSLTLQRNYSELVQYLTIFDEICSPAQHMLYLGRVSQLLNLLSDNFAS